MISEDSRKTNLFIHLTCKTICPVLASLIDPHHIAGFYKLHTSSERYHRPYHTSVGMVEALALIVRLFCKECKEFIYLLMSFNRMSPNPLLLAKYSWCTDSAPAISVLKMRSFIHQILRDTRGSLTTALQSQRTATHSRV